jgi:antitoxin CptB
MTKAPETPEARLGRLRTRSMWRGIREMDLILRDFAGRELAGLSPADLDLYEDLLAEIDHDLLLWITGAAPAPPPLRPPDRPHPGRRGGDHPARLRFRASKIFDVSPRTAPGR